MVSTSESSPTSTDHWHPDHNFGFDKLVRHKLMASHWPWNAPIYVPVNRSGLHSLLFKYVRGPDRFLTYGRRGIHLLISFGLALQHLVSPTATPALIQELRQSGWHSCHTHDQPAFSLAVGNHSCYRNAIRHALSQGVSS